MSNPEVLDIIKNVLQNFDPLNEDDQEAAVFATTFNHFRQRGGATRHGIKKINEEYTADLEERVKAEKEAQELKEWRMENTKKLQ